MFGTTVIVVMLLLRLVIPVGLLLWVGESVRRRYPAAFDRRPSQA